MAISQSYGGRPLFYSTARGQHGDICRMLIAAVAQTGPPQLCVARLFQSCVCFFMFVDAADHVVRMPITPPSFVLHVQVPSLLQTWCSAWLFLGWNGSAVCAGQIQKEGESASCVTLYPVSSWGGPLHTFRRWTKLWMEKSSTPKVMTQHSNVSILWETPTISVSMHTHTNKHRERKRERIPREA